MFNELESLLERAYAPYSHFLVSSIVITNDGKIFKGVNVENSTLGATSCAERNAIFSAISQGVKFGEIKEVHIFAKNLNDPNDPEFFVMPCGICRQVIFEASNGKAKIFTYNKNGNQKDYEIKELLPYDFVFKN